MKIIKNQHAGISNLDPPVINFFKNHLECKTMLDVGCGLGGQVELARMLEVDAYGIDGDFETIPKEEYYRHVDYRKTSSNFLGPFDFAWSCEFAEHIEKKYIPNFMVDFQKCKYVVFCAAPPGWGGVNHVNEQEEDYWIQKFHEFDFTYDENLTNEIRKVSDNGRRGIKQFMRNRGLVFVNS